MRHIVASVGTLWALACLGLRFSLHGRLLAAGAPLPDMDQILKNLSGPWLRRVAVAVAVVAIVRDSGAFKVAARGIGLREVLVVIVAGFLRLCSGATFWAETRAVDEQRLHRLDLRASLTWEFAFWTHIGLNTLPFCNWS